MYFPTQGDCNVSRFLSRNSFFRKIHLVCEKGGRGGREQKKKKRRRNIIGMLRCLFSSNRLTQAKLKAVWQTSSMMLATVFGEYE